MNQKKKIPIAKSKFKTYYKDKVRYMLCRNSKEGDRFSNGKICDIYTKVPNDVVKVLCWKCTNKLIEDKVPTKRKSDKPRGWAFMKEYVHTDAKVYHYGVEQSILYGTKFPTIIKPKPKRKRLTKQQVINQTIPLYAEINKLKKKHKKEKRKTFRSKIQVEINKIKRQIKNTK